MSKVILKRQVIATVLLIMSVVVLLACTHNKNLSTSVEYKEVSLTDLKTMMEEEKEFYVYFGRDTCPHCRIFQPKLNEAINKTNRTVYYINTKDRNDAELADLRTKYDIKTVPSLNYFTGEACTDFLKINDQTTVNDIEEFLNADR